MGGNKMVLDARAKQLSEIVINYSTKIQQDDILLIRGEDAFEGFAKLIGKLANEKGADVIYELNTPHEQRALIERNNHAELEAESVRLCTIAEEATASVKISAMVDPYYLKGVDPKKIAEYSSIIVKPLLDRIVGNGKEFKGTKWNVVGLPCEGVAKEAGMTLPEYADFVYGATNIDWSKTRAEMQKVKDIFDNADDVHIYVSGMTDLHISLRGRGGCICDGEYNMPDGEVFYGPVEDSAEGYISFPYPTLRDGNVVSGIELSYKNGEVTDFRAKENHAYLEAMLELQGVKRIGELGIGCNYGIKIYTQDLLFDEKIGGTIHLAIGDSYKDPLDEGGGLNDAKIHWDLVCDLRKTSNNPGGKLYVNNKLVQMDGIWLFK